MAKFSLALLASLASVSAFVPQQSAVSQSSALHATGFEEVGGKAWDPLSLAKLGLGRSEDGEGFDTFPNMFPHPQYLEEAEIKHGRQAMLAWTGIWATHQVRKNIKFVTVADHSIIVRPQNNVLVVSY